jgi:N4-gp56 family major capsid protein
MALNTTSNIPPEVNVYFDRMLLEFAKSELIYDQFAQQRTMPMNSGRQQIFRRYGTLLAATTPLVEGETKAPNTMAVTDMYVEIKQYGDYQVMSDWLQMTVQDKVVAEAVKIQAYQMALTIDTILRDMMYSTLSAINCSRGGNLLTPTELTDDDLMSVVLGLRQGDAKMISQMINPSTGFNTAGTLPSFVGLMSVDLMDDLQDLDSFQTLEKYSSTKQLYKGEIGSTPYIRWCLSTNGFVTGGVYSNFVVAREAYGSTKLTGKAAQVILKQLGSSGVADALDQRSSVGWKTNYACRVLNDNWIAKVNCTHS